MCWPNTSENVSAETGQADPGPPDLVTDQVGPKQENLVTDQVDTPPTSLSTAQVEPLTELSATQRKIVEFCDIPRSLMEIKNALRVTSRRHLKKRHLDPLLRGGVLRMAHPDQPNHPRQAYLLTEAGVALKTRRMDGDAGPDNGGRTNGG